MDAWEKIKGLGVAFDTFFENIPKRDRAYLMKCSVSKYDEYMRENFLEKNGAIVPNYANIFTNVISTRVDGLKQE